MSHSLYNKMIAYMNKNNISLYYLARHSNIQKIINEMRKCVLKRDEHIVNMIK